MKHITKKLERDKHVVEAVIHRFGPISRVGIHKLTNLRQTTISAITRQLLDEGRLVEAGRSNNPLGRKQTLLDANEEHGFMVGIEFDDKKVVAGVMDLHPAIRYIVSEPANLHDGLDGLVLQLKSLVTRSLQESCIDPSLLIGIGIGDPGLVDTHRGITVLAATIDFWNDVPLKKLFEEAFQVPTTVESKTRAKTVAERVLGAGEMQENMVYFDYGAGIGAGIIAEGKLLYGQNCGAGEVGHTRVSENGPSCKCGSVGCMEATAGTSAIEARIRRVLAEGASSQVLSLAANDPAKITAWMVFKAAQAGDKVCGNIVYDFAHDVGVGIANVVNLLNPAIVIFDKRLEPAGIALLDQITRVVRGQTIATFSETLTLRFGQLGEEAGILGLGLLILEKYFGIPTSYMITDVLLGHTDGMKRLAAGKEYSCLESISRKAQQKRILVPNGSPS